MRQNRPATKQEPDLSVVNYTAKFLIMASSNRILNDDLNCVKIPHKMQKVKLKISLHSRAVRSGCILFIERSEYHKLHYSRKCSSRPYCTEAHSDLEQHCMKGTFRLTYFKSFIFSCNGNKHTQM